MRLAKCVLAIFRRLGGAFLKLGQNGGWYGGDHDLSCVLIKAYVIHSGVSIVLILVQFVVSS